MTFTTLKKIGESILNSFDGAISRYSLAHHDAPVYSRIDATLLALLLDEQFGGHVLGITDADLICKDDFFDSIFAGKLTKSDVALVSLRRLEMPGFTSKIDRETLMQRLTKASLHEIGHNFGLDHHYSLRKGGDGQLCPMSKGNYNKYGEVSYIRAIIDGRGYRFCNECYESIKLRNID